MEFGAHPGFAALRHATADNPTSRALEMTNARMLAALILLTACSTPVSVSRVDSQDAHRALIANVLLTGDLSAFTENVLRLHALEADSQDRAVAALKTLHDNAAVSGFPPKELFALAELSFRIGVEQEQPRPLPCVGVPDPLR